MMSTPGLPHLFILFIEYVYDWRFWPYGTCTVIETGTHEAVRILWSSDIHSAFNKFIILLRAYCKWWFQFRRNLLNSSSGPGTEDTNVMRYSPCPGETSSAGLFNPIDWIGVSLSLLPVQVETHNIINFLYSVYDTIELSPSFFVLSCFWCIYNIK